MFHKRVLFPLVDGRLVGKNLVSGHVGALLGLFFLGLLLLYGDADHVAPLAPRAVVDPDLGVA